MNRQEWREQQVDDRLQSTIEWSLMLERQGITLWSEKFADAPYEPYRTRMHCIECQRQGLDCQHSIEFTEYEVGEFLYVTRGGHLGEKRLREFICYLSRRCSHIAAFIEEIDKGA